MPVMAPGKPAAQQYKTEMLQSCLFVSGSSSLVGETEASGTRLGIQGTSCCRPCPLTVLLNGVECA